MSVGVPGAAVAAPPADAARVAAIRNNLDLNDTGAIAAFGDRARRELLAGVERLLAEARAADAAEATSLVERARERIETLDPSELQPRGGLDNLFNGRTARLHRFRRASDQAWEVIEPVVTELQTKVGSLETRNRTLDSLHEQTRALILELDAYLQAGRMRLAEARATAPLSESPETPPPPQDGEPRGPGPAAVKDISAADRLAARLGDLEQTRAMAVRQLPIVRLVQNVDSFLIQDVARAEKALSVWWESWTRMLGSARERTQPHIPTLADQKLTVLQSLEQVRKGLEESHSRRIEAEAAMARAAQPALKS